jgi:hypothetical protein
MASYGNIFSSNPYRVGGIPSLGSMNRAGGFTTVSPQTFALGNIGRSGNASPFAGSRRTSASMGRMLDEEPTEEDVLGYGKEKRGGGGGKIDALKRLFTGESGSAVGGIAQGLGTAVGGYLQRKTQREQIEEEKRRNALEEENNARVRALLMPLLQEQLERQRKYQQVSDQQLGR